jgi:hypothetical protein
MPNYSPSDIDAAWEAYSTRTVLRILRGGKWYTEPLDGRPRGAFEGTSAGIKQLKDVMSFPEFLRKEWKK